MIGRQLLNRARHPLVQRAFHLLALWALAVAQPVLDLLGRNAEFFAVRGSSAGEVVLFALALTVVAPLLLGLEVAACHLASPRIGAGLHIALVAVLSGAFALQLLREVGELPAPIMIAGALLIGALCALAYTRLVPVRSFLTVLAPAALVFLLLFLFATPVRDLLVPANAAAAGAGAATNAPVVFVVFDEFPLASLLDQQQQIDRRRFPNFAQLARESTWYRNTTSVSDNTTTAVPALLTGQRPEEGDLPTLRSHPRNLFTMLSGRYRIHASETITQMCPPGSCQRDEQARVTGATSLWTDTAVVYLHLLLPDSYRSHLPSIEYGWQGFAAASTAGHGADEDDAQAPHQQLERFLAGIDDSRDRQLHFLHSLLPHAPWDYLPSGQRYGRRTPVPGLADDWWSNDERLVVQGQQRHLLQAQYADAALGQIRRRLAAVGLERKAMLVVVSDHGAGFVAGEPRREATNSNLAELAFVPLFIKAPGQRHRISDEPVQTIDVLPTIAAILSADAGRTDGRVVGRSRQRSGSDLPVERYIDSRRVGRLQIDAPAQAQLRGVVREKFRRFGARDFLHPTGTSPRVGAPLSAFELRKAKAQFVSIDQAKRLNSVDLDGPFVPAYLSGTIRGPAAADRFDIAIVVNEVVAGTGRTYPLVDRGAFGFVIDPAALAAGHNEVRVFRVHDEGGTVALEELQQGAAAVTQPKRVAPFKLMTKRGRSVLVARDGRELPVRPSIEGALDRSDKVPPRAVFAGWAVDSREQTAADEVILFSHDRFLARARPTLARPDVARRYGDRSLVHTGFVFEVPFDRVRIPGRRIRIRAFAISGESAAELRYDCSRPQQQAFGCSPTEG